MSHAPRRASLAKVLVVDDDRAILRTMEVNLRARGYEPLLAGSGREALVIAARRRPDVVVLDLGLPDLDGVEVIEGLRGWTSLPIIVLSARSQEAEKLAAFDAGSTDYMTKPFGIAEFMARLRVALRARPASPQTTLVEAPDFTLDLSRKRALRDGREVRLTATEWQIITLLAGNPGCLVTQAQILEQVWGLKNTKNNYVRVYLAAIRRKLEPDPGGPRYFITEPGLGVRFDPSGTSAASQAGTHSP